MNDLGYKLFLDRYAIKDPTKNFEVGDTVVVSIDETGQTEVATVQAISDELILVKFRLDGKTDSVHKNHISRPVELHPDEMFTRVAIDISRAEKHKKEEWSYKFKWLLDDFKFVPGGRILAGAGMNEKLTLFNCYVLPSPRDSRQGIMKTLADMTEIMSRGGGVGINLSTLRPRHSQVKGVSGRSSGSVSWGEIYSYTTGLIEQGGSRRGALMLMLADWHPDIIEFISSKKDMRRIINANISVCISDRFMEAVKEDEDWKLIFPDTSHPDYDNDWNGDIWEWIEQKKEFSFSTYKTIKARELWDMIVESAWASAEPGLWFIDRANYYSNSYYYDPLIATNPCGEEPLPGWGICNLGSINLSKFVSENGVKWYELGKAVRYAVRFLDNVIDRTLYVSEENEKQQKKERRIGLGTMGLAEMLIKLGLRYGSQESINFIDSLYKFICSNAYCASANLALEKGVFPQYDYHSYPNGNFVLLLPLKVYQKVLKQGMRNVTVLTQAPTGTIGTMIDTSTGIEPFYYWSYIRSDRSGKSEVAVQIYKDWIDMGHKITELPNYFVTAMDLDPEDHVKVQAAIQRWNDSSISKTCNVPENYTKEQIGELYRLMYDLDCKGGTVYRDKSRNVQVLSLKDDKKKSEQKSKVRDKKLEGRTYKQQTPVGSAYVTINKNGIDPFEVFITVGKSGTEISADAEALGRLISLILRMPSELNPNQRIKEIVGQLRNIGSGRQSGFGPHRVMSLPDGIAQVLIDDLMLKEDELPKLPDINDNVIGDICPDCGNATLIHIEGCRKCNCGYSEC